MHCHVFLLLFLLARFAVSLYIIHPPETHHITRTTQCLQQKAVCTPIVFFPNCTVYSSRYFEPLARTNMWSQTHSIKERYCYGHLVLVASWCNGMIAITQHAVSPSYMDRVFGALWLTNNTRERVAKRMHTIGYKVYHRGQMALPNKFCREARVTLQ